jgi:hypothetical protein
VLTYLVLAPLTGLFVQRLDPNPLSYSGALLPLAVGAPLVFAVALLSLVVRSPRLAGVGAALASCWVLFCMLVSHHGTPFADSGLRGDTGRLTAMITRFTVTTEPVDAFVPSVPTEYPPLFPWVLARIAVWLDRPGWTMLGVGESVLLSLAVLAGFVLWQRLVPAWVAVALALTAPLAFAQPRKSYEIFVLAITTPWALATLSRFRQPGGLHWLPAGILLGLMVQVYQGYLLFVGLGLVVITLAVWFRSPHRWRYALHVTGVLVTAVAVAAWYLVPFLRGVLEIGGNRQNDSYVAGDIAGDPLGLRVLLEGPLTPLRIAGVVGLIVLARRRWWSPPILALIGSAYLYRMAYLVVFVTTGHTGYLDYTGRILGALYIASGVMVVAEGVRWLAARAATRTGGLARVPQVAAVRGPRALGAASVAVFATATMVWVWPVWMPTPAGLSERVGGTESPNLAALAHGEPLPDGTATRWRVPPSAGAPWFPTSEVLKSVRSRYGQDAAPVTLSASERLFAYVPWPAYMAVAGQASNTFTHWDERLAEVRALAVEKDPARFTAASADTAFGGIDVFVLKVDKEKDLWRWEDVAFTPAQFDPQDWDVVGLSRSYVVVVRNSPVTARLSGSG